MVTGLFGISLQSSDNNLRRLTEKAFTSVQSVWQARAVAYDAKADQDSYLIQRGGGKKYETSFDVKAKSLLDNIQQSNAVDTPRSEPARKDMLTAYKGFVDMQAQLKQLDKGGERTRAVQTARVQWHRQRQCRVWQAGLGLLVGAQERQGSLRPVGGQRQE